MGVWDGYISKASFLVSKNNSSSSNPTVSSSCSICLLFWTLINVLLLTYPPPPRPRKAIWYILCKVAAPCGTYFFLLFSMRIRIQTCEQLWTLNSILLFRQRQSSLHFHPCDTLSTNTHACMYCNSVGLTYTPSLSLWYTVACTHAHSVCRVSFKLAGLETWSLQSQVGHYIFFFTRLEAFPVINLWILSFSGIFKKAIITKL